MDIQQRLDEWLASNPAAQKYVTQLYYVPEGEVPPADATHILRLTSMQSPERALRVAVVVKPGFAAFLDALLAMIATQPRTGSEPI
jgi:hypothetical protein